MRALVTGSNGFVGRHLRAHLRQCGDDVYGVDREHDVTSESAMTQVFERARPEVIYHLAALTHVGASWDNPVEYTRVNVEGTRHVLDAAHRVVPTATVLVVSSSDVYGAVGEGDLPIVESQSVAPTNPYATSKVDAEVLALAAARDRNQRVLIARPFNHVGPGQATSFVVPAIASRLLDALEHGEDEIAVGDLSPRRDFTDARDVVRAYRLLVELGATGEIYNVASGVDVSIDDVAHELVRRVAPRVALVLDPALLRPVEVPVSRGSAERLRDTTGWTPSIELTTSLDDVVRELKNQRRAH